MLFSSEYFHYKIFIREKTLRKLEPLAARYNWCEGPVPGRGPAVEKHCFIGLFTVTLAEIWGRPDQLPVCYHNIGRSMRLHLSPGTWSGTGWNLSLDVERRQIKVSLPASWMWLILAHWPFKAYWLRASKSLTIRNCTFCQNCIYVFCVEIKCQLDATAIFIADLIACSTCFGHHYAHHQELKSIIQWLLPVVFRAVVFK